MDALEAINTRRSIREFLPDPVPDGDIDRILDAASHAPSSGNRQPWRFLVVTDRESLERLLDQAIAAIEERIDESDKLPDEEKLSFIRRERGAGEFTRTIVLPDAVEAEKIEASLHDGIMTIRLPKAAAAQPRQIEIKPCD